VTWPLIGIFLLAAVAALKIGSTFVLPIVVSVLFTFLLGPAVRWLKARGIPEALGAGMLVFGTVTALCFSLYFLADPAAQWMEAAPKTMEQVERKLKRVFRPFANLQATASKVEEATTPATGTDDTQKVQLAKPGLLSRLSGTTASVLGALLTVIFLTYFLLAAGTLFREKLAEVLPRRTERAHVVEALAEIEVQMSRYLVLTTIINAVVGLLTWGALALLGMPNAALWGAVAGVLNYIPYVGALATLILIGVAGLVSFDQPKTALLAAGAFFIINMIESNLATPMILGRRLPLNAVALFMGLLFWGWIWGITGAVLAVPLTVMVKIICDHVKPLQPVALFLDS
jgi:predicted PurR-regulated permease PerM